MNCVIKGQFYKEIFSYNTFEKFQGKKNIGSHNMTVL